MAPFETSPDDLSVVDELKRLLTLTTHQRVIQMLKIEIESLTQEPSGDNSTLGSFFGISQSNKEPIAPPGSPNPSLGVALASTHTPEVMTHERKDDILTHMGLVLRHVDSGYVCGSAELLEANETVVNLFTGKDVNAVWDPFSSKWRPSKWNCSWSPTSAHFVQYRCRESSPCVAVAAYSLCSANDHPERDPSAWYFQGSLDGDNWYTLDRQQGVSFEERKKRLTFSVPEESRVPLRNFRLVIVALKDESIANSVQLRSFALYQRVGIASDSH
ncbi:hypothetical protein CYMTET_27933 [Cymbomonas tetramitiformis]|uniref:Uncharacterized protein n=1 Tax=Cymbomonas tetramitiformis TaxID=36881 RepID=A0AAE0FP40_9CHLO|nr:hypothetical protein CYMTET_33778 [Cymbomonas tetramitiformis]KAK3263245.1 hypothetical protein CYMTET_27933 [Cymbomonas tetramitiformis]